jgi:hypothetical protein
MVVSRSDVKIKYQVQALEFENHNGKQYDKNCAFFFRCIVTCDFFFASLEKSFLDAVYMKNTFTQKLLWALVYSKNISIYRNLFQFVWHIAVIFSSRDTELY